MNHWSIRSGSKSIWGIIGPAGLRAWPLTLEDNGETLLTGLVVDQAALHSVLKKVRDVGMPLLSVNHVTLGLVEEKPVNQEMNG